MEWLPSGAMRQPAYQLLRIPLPRTRVNRVPPAHGLPNTHLWLRDVPRAHYDPQGLRDHREHGGLVPYDLSVNGELQAPRAGLDSDLLRPGKEDPFFVQVVRVGQDRGGELEYLLHSDIFYDHEVQESVLRVGSFSDSLG